MDIETATNETIEQQLLHGEAAIAPVRATQMVLLREVDRRQAPMAAGCGSLGEWVRGRVDVSPETARDLVATAKHLEELPDVQEAIETGEIGFDRAVVVGTFAGKDDTFPAEPGAVSRAVRNADALWAISLDTLHGGDGASIEDPTPLLAVFVDTNEAILCDGIIEVTARTKHGTPLTMGRRTRAIPPQMRRFVLDRDGAACTIAGCTSRYRLQVHHIIRWVDGGRTDPENLTTATPPTPHPRPTLARTRTSPRNGHQRNSRIANRFLHLRGRWQRRSR